MNTDLPPLMDPEVPSIRLVHSANSLSTLMADPAWYEMIYVRGHRFDLSREAPLGFGSAYHSALEAGEKALIATGSWQSAREASTAKAHAIAAEGGLWEDRYRTAGSLKKVIAGYWQHWEHSKHEPLAIEVPWTFELPVRSPSKLPYVVCGRFDAIARVFGHNMVMERKHTTKPLDWDYWANYRRAVQTRTYALAAHAGRGNVSVCLDACRLHLAEPKRGEVKPPEFARQVFEFTRADLECHLQDIIAWISAAQMWALNGHWPRRSSPWGPGKSWCDLLELPPQERFKSAPDVQPFRHPLQSIVAEEE